MIKKASTTIAVMLLLFCCFITPVVAAASDPEVTSPAAIAIEVSTGTVLYGENIDEQMGIASLTKLMTVYVFLEEATAQGIELTDTYAMSAHASNLKTQAVDISGVYFYEGQEITAKQLLELTIVYSDNGAAIALAEMASGTEQAHVDKMNAQAEEWGLTQTHFYNASGLTMYNYGDEALPGTNPTDYNVSTAREMAFITRELVMKYPEVLEYTAMETIEYNGETLYSYNQMLPSGSHYYPGVTGMKTGTEDEAGACFISYYTFEEMNYITVVLGAEDSDDRYIQTAYMLDWIQTIELHPAFGDMVFNIPVEGSSSGTLALKPQTDVLLVEGQMMDVQIADITYNPKYFNEDGRLIEGIPEGEEVMTVTLASLTGEDDVQTITSTENLEIVLVSDTKIKEQSFVGDIVDATVEFVSGLFNSIIKI